MIKKIALVFLLLPLYCLGQKSLKGKFCESGGYGYECITFLKNQKFILDGSSCLGNYVGKGTYNLKNDTLILSYLDTLEKSNEFELIKKTPTKSDSSELKIFVTDKKNDPVPFAQVYLFSKIPVYQDKPIDSTSSDKDGVANLKYIDSSNKIFVKVWYVTRNPIIKSLPNGYDYIVNAKINMHAPSLLPAMQEFYKVEFKNSKYLLLDDLEDSGTSLREFVKEKN